MQVFSQRRRKLWKSLRLHRAQFKQVSSPTLKPMLKVPNARSHSAQISNTWCQAHPSIATQREPRLEFPRFSTFSFDTCERHGGTNGCQRSRASPQMILAMSHLLRHGQQPTSSLGGKCRPLLLSGPSGSGVRMPGNTQDFFLSCSLILLESAAESAPSVLNESRPERTIFVDICGRAAWFLDLVFTKRREVGQSSYSAWTSGQQRQIARGRTRLSRG